MLDFAQVAPQIYTFASDQERSLPRWQEALQEAYRRLTASGADWETTAVKITESRTSWLVARWQETPPAVSVPPNRPSAWTVFAADGSQIVSERHDIALCYLLNVGLIALRYGTGERPTLATRPTLYQPDTEMLDTGEGDTAVIVPRRLAVRRLLAEMHGLAEMIVAESRQENASVGKEPAETSLFPAQPASLPYPALALFDGSLILWTLENEEEEFRIPALRDFQNVLETARERRVPLAGYISLPGSRDVINSLRVFVCPHEQARCDTHCPNRRKSSAQFPPPPCAGTEQITDADLFAKMLLPGERSAVFGSSSQILKEYMPPHRIHFFYLHTGQEIARVEIPYWVAADSALLEQTHALIVDQAQKGEGYPVALAEAHEQATVRGSEKEAFFRLMERRLIETHQTVRVTQKRLAKRARRI